MKCKDCNVTGCPNRGSNAVFSKPCNIINQNSFDWQFFRAEAAKDILCAMIPQENNIISKDLVRYAIMITDELVKQLKEKEEKEWLQNNN